MIGFINMAAVKSARASTKKDTTGSLPTNMTTSLPSNATTSLPSNVTTTPILDKVVDPTPVK